MVGFSRVTRVSRVSRVRMKVSVRIRVRFSFCGVNRPYWAHYFSVCTRHTSALFSHITGASMPIHRWLSTEHQQPTVASLSVCVGDVALWLSASRLCLNAANTVLMWLGSDQQMEKFLFCRRPLQPWTVQDLGVMDRHLTMSVHGSSVCQSAYCFLHQLHQVVRFVSVDVAKAVVHEFILLHWHYCNSLLYGISSILFQHSQAIQNAWSLAPNSVTTLPQSCSNYTGYQYDSEWNLSLLSWSTRCSTTWHHHICQTIARSLPSPGAVSFDLQTVSVALSLLTVHILESKHSLLPYHTIGTVFRHVCRLVCR